MARKDMGHIYPEGFVAPTPTGKKATVELTVRVFVEVNETDDYLHMVSQAKDSLRKRVIEGKGFYPFAARAERIHNDVEVEELKYHTVVEPRGKW
jgi:very-short-patch-repair endonuclease